MTGFKYDRNFLREHYDSILQKNYKILLAGGNGRIDFTDFVDNNVRSLVVLVRLAQDVGQRISECIESLKKIEPDMYFYPQKDFHVTVLDVLKGEAGRQIPENISQYIEAVRECAKSIEPFEIEFDGLTASDNAVMVRGFYEPQLQILRENLRHELRVRNLILDERYETFSSHVTIARLCDKYSEPARILSFVNTPVSFGKMRVKSLEISFHSWCDSKKKVLCELPL